MDKDKFTKLFHIENIEEVPKLFELDEVIVTEKIHGSSMRIGVVDGQLRLGGRRHEFTDIRPDTKEGLGFISWVLDVGLDKKILETFGDTNIIFYGEWHGSGTPKKGWPQIQKGIKYIDGNDFRIFDIRVGGQYLSQDEIGSWAGRIGLKVVPILYRGRPDGKVFNSLIDTMSRLGEENGIADPENTIEGIVIRPPEPSWDERGNPIIAKYKVGKWAERASQRKRPPRPPKKQIEIPGAREFAEEFVTETRLEHVLDQLRQEGLPIGRSSMGEYLKRMGQDIKREGAGSLEKNNLEWKDVSSHVTKMAKNLFLDYIKKMVEEA